MAVDTMYIHCTVYIGSPNRLTHLSSFTRRPELMQVHLHACPKVRDVKEKKREESNQWLNKSLEQGLNLSRS